jgi:hypothetical protein
MDGVAPPYWQWLETEHGGGLDADMVDGKHVSDLFPNVKQVVVPTNAGWTTSLLNSGAVTQDIFALIPHTGNTANSRALANCIAIGLNSGDRNVEAVDYSKALELSFFVDRVNSDAQVIGRVQLKQTASEGVLANTGIGLQISNYTVSGEAYGSARQTLALGELTNNRLWRVKIVVVPGVRVEFWVNDVLVGSLTGTAVPTGVNATSRLVISIINGASGGTDCFLNVGNIKIIQNW